MALFGASSKTWAKAARSGIAERNGANASRIISETLGDHWSDIRIGGLVVPRLNLQAKLAALRADYGHVTGAPFTHFFCPILFRDEATELCTAHVVNRAFPDSARIWTVQRKDVDGFFGSCFESDFVTLIYKDGGSVGDVFTNPTLQKRFTTKVLHEGKQIDHHVSDSPREAPGFTQIRLEHNGVTVPLNVKATPEELFERGDAGWAIEIEKDLRLPSRVALIKAAHLGLFHLLGYRYILSASGHFVGWDILGSFFIQSKGKQKRQIISDAHDHFASFIHMVRPVTPGALKVRGSVSDRIMALCGWNGRSAWGLITFIRTSAMQHAVLLPVMETADAAACFIKFLSSDEESIDATWCRYTTDHWEIDNHPTQFVWPKRGAGFA